MGSLWELLTASAKAWAKKRDLRIFKVKLVFTSLLQG